MNLIIYMCNNLSYIAIFVFKRYIFLYEENYINHIKLEAERSLTIMPLASSGVKQSGPGICNLIILNLRPFASVLFVKVLYASNDLSYCGSALSSVQARRTVPGLTKQQKLSTWPFVSSSAASMGLDGSIKAYKSFHLVAKTQCMF